MNRQSRTIPISLIWVCLGCLPTVAADVPVTDVNISAKCHVAFERNVWAGDQIVRFYAYITDTEFEWLRLVSLPDLGCMVEVDSVWYRFVGSQWVDGLNPIVSDYWRDSGAYLTVALCSRHWQSVVDGRPLKLTPGEHSIRFAWAEHERKAPPRLISEMKTIRIEGPIAADVNDGASEVRDLFLAFIGRPGPPANPEVPRMLKSDLIRSGDWIPKFDWADVPVLLKLAENGVPLRGTVPSLPVVSRPVVECPEGMVALWLIEGLRQRQLSLARDRRAGEQAAGKLYYRLPFQPICERAGTPIWQTENDPAVYRMVLDAYQRWWKKAASLPADRAAAIDPLDSTGLAWHGP